MHINQQQTSIITDLLHRLPARCDRATETATCYGFRHELKIETYYGIFMLDRSARRDWSALYNGIVIAATHVNDIISELDRHGGVFDGRDEGDRAIDTIETCINCIGLYNEQIEALDNAVQLAVSYRRSAQRTLPG